VRMLVSAYRTAALLGRELWLVDFLMPKLRGVNTVSPTLIPSTAEEGWQAPCGECFRVALATEPWDEQPMRPIQHGHRGRR
jgi:hypothetical protein